MNNTEPTGGVRRPIPQFRMTIIPNCTVLMPIDCATGSNIGVAIRIIGAMSIMQPNTSNIAFSISAIAIGLLDMLVIKRAAFAGTCRTVKQYPNAAEVAIKINTIARVSTQVSRAFQTPFNVKPL